MLAIDPEDADKCFEELKAVVPSAQKIGRIKALEGDKRIIGFIPLKTALRASERRFIIEAVFADHAP
ncbi:MAG: hypothetical protein MJ194_06880 [Clostridia bacterium]|nr:hypothetical protein [Clostridia bacterium]